MDDIKPALSAEEWASARRTAGAFGSFQSFETYVGDDPSVCAYLIALNNAALPDSDPRKLTWAHVDALRSASERLITLSQSDYNEASSGKVRELNALAAIIASYLQPRETP